MAYLVAAVSVTQASETVFTGDARRFVQGNDLAMGLACLRANHFRTQPVHIALWEGEATLVSGGAADMLVAWRATGRTTPARCTVCCVNDYWLNVYNDLGTAQD